MNNIVSNNSPSVYHETLNNLIENITMRQSVNIKLWIFIRSTDDSHQQQQHYNADFSFLLDKTNNMTKMLYTTDYHQERKTVLTERRDYAAIFLGHSIDNRLENWLNLSRKMPPDSIKIYLNQNDCQLNETRLSEIMSKLWWSIDDDGVATRGSEIGFIYYISLCHNITSRENSENSGYDGDYGQQTHRNNYIVNLFYYKPFQRHKSAAEQKQFPHWQHRQKKHVRGIMEKINLINGNGEWIDISNIQAFHYFPFTPYKLNFDEYQLTVILFPSTMAYTRISMGIFKKYLSIEILEDPLHHIEAYFGEDVEALKQLRKLLNFSINLSLTSDMAFYGFKVSS